MSALRVRDLLERKRDVLSLELLTDEEGLDRPIPSPDVSSPGLALAGYTERFVSDRIQVLGETEIAFLSSLPDDECSRALDGVLACEVPCLIITKGQDPPEALTRAARLPFHR